MPAECSTGLCTLYTAPVFAMSVRPYDMNITSHLNDNPTARCLTWTATHARGVTADATTRQSEVGCLLTRTRRVRSEPATGCEGSA